MNKLSIKGKMPKYNVGDYVFYVDSYKYNKYRVDHVRIIQIPLYLTQNGLIWEEEYQIYNTKSQSYHICDEDDLFDNEDEANDYVRELEE